MAILSIAALPTLSGVPYLPTPDQAAFLESPWLQSWFISGFGGGKTEALCKRVLIRALRHPGVHGLGAPTHGMLKRTTWRTMKASVPKQLLAARMTEPPDARIELINGSIIEGYHLSDPDALDGPNLSSFGIDEVNNRRVKEEAVDRVINRLRGGGGRFPERLDGSGNPRGHNWFWARYVATKVELLAEGKTEKDIRTLFAQRRYASVFTTTTYANRAHLGEWYISQMEALYPEGTRRDRAMHASFAEASGDVYEDFDSRQHIIPAPDDWDMHRGVDGISLVKMPPKYLLRVGGVDFGGVHPFAFEGVAVDTRPGRGKEIFYVFAEHHQASEPDPLRHAQKIRPHLDHPAHDGVGWELFSEHEPHTRATLQKKDYLGRPMMPAWKATEELRISELNKLCREDRFFIIGDEVGGGLLRPRCPGLVANLTQRERETEGPKRGMPEDANNDATDATEYAIGSWVKYGARSTKITQW